MPRLLGVDIPNDKTAVISLSYLYGVGPATARELLRPTFRNWFRPRYPYVYATFRCAQS